MNCILHTVCSIKYECCPSNRLEEFSPNDIEYELEEMESRNLRLIENWQESGISFKLTKFLPK